MERCDVLVVGGGAMGTASAWQLAKHSTKRCVVLEAQPFGHEKGSSHGESRIYRKTDTDPLLARMAIDALPLWRELEADSGVQVLRTVGGIDVGPAGGDAMQRIVANSRGVPGARVLKGEAIAEALPGMGPIPADAVAVAQPDGAIINAAVAVETMRREATRHGARFVPEARVVAITRPVDGGDVYTVRTAGGATFVAHHVVLTAGAWTSEALGLLGVPLRSEIWQMQYGFWEVDAAAVEDHTHGPVWRSFYDRLYGFPINEKAGHIKLAQHNVSKANTFHHPRDVTYAVSMAVLEATDREVKRLLHGLGPYHPGPPCLYTVAADGKFVLGDLPGTAGRVVVAGAFAGSGFKHVPHVGKIVKDLVCHGRTEIDVSPFCPGREALRPRL